MLSIPTLCRLAPLAALLLTASCADDDDTPAADPVTFEKNVRLPADFYGPTDLAELTDGSIFVLASASAGLPNATPDASKITGIRLTAAGDTLWTQRYVFGPALTSYGYGYGYSCLATPDGNVVFTAITPFAGGAFHPRLTKLNTTTGAVLWTLELPDEVVTTTCKIALSAAGNFLVIDNEQLTEFRLHTVSASGALVSSVTVPQGFAADICPTADGNFMVASVQDAFSQQQPVLTKLTPQGTVLWSRTATPTGFGLTNSVVQTPDGGYALAGGLRYIGTTGNLKLLKTDANGQEQFVYTYSDIEGYATKLGLSPDNKLILVGQQNTSSGSSSARHPLALRLDPATGTEQQRQARLTVNGSIQSFVATRDGKLLFCSGEGNSALVLRKTNPDFTQ